VRDKPIALLHLELVRVEAHCAVVKVTTKDDPVPKEIVLALGESFTLVDKGRPWLTTS
jgi:hypothetical protein